MGRRFAVVSAYQGRGVTLPRRHTPQAAGYDLAAAETVVIAPGEVALVPTGLKAYLEPGEVLKVYIRSSLAVRRRLTMANGVGIIDADYVDNPDNEGHILLALENRGTDPQVVEAGERVAQGIFERYLTVDEDAPAGDGRSGGFGSTGSGAAGR
ncbi:Deoxyuridine 5'-triphosphate nucleotidohydrolase [Candidatus Hydrogenisulfobacillus filiaventi]|uniref:dUTP diphosphatase n=1 Tax=Candidatus Hydrogenisulfobacillus filiaventi TaxID=2707344 RepID=A0A6F8ZEL3_9FIRM|nr:dUTP diphosphatase [Bacillota bacterium]CAB1128083.1 Deoxyuridine 5'-triphosphate nucleotidohydrolase [Candidatus Hydrogenisulfobacillus filiaventi]